MSLTQTEVFEILTKKLGHTNFDLDEFTLEHIQSGSGMMGEHMCLECHITLPPKSTFKEIHSFFVKKKCLDPNFEEFPDLNFRKEVATYNLLNLMSPMVTSSIPELYYTDSKHIVIDDLISQGFILQDSQKVSTEEELFKILETLAGIHAGSIIYEETQRIKTQNPRYTLNDNFPDVFNETYFIKDKALVISYIQASIKGLRTGIDVFNIPETLKNGKNFKQELDQIWDLVIENVQPSKKFRNALCHCDLWTANLFLQYDDLGKTTRAKIIDFQLTRYLPPAFDVLDVVFLNTKRDYRKKNLERLQKWYFDCFCRSLREGDVDPDMVYTWEEFLESFEEVEFLAIFLECLTVPLVYMEKKKFSQLLNSEDKAKIMFEDRSPLMTQFQENEYFMSRVRDTMLDLEEYFEKH